MRKVLVIGTGGIGSFLIPILDRVDLYDITVADPDKVEAKNLTYQNFEYDDIGEYKVDAMEHRYCNLKTIKYPILSEKQMKGYDLVICCVDNIGLRRTMYNCKDLKWLDLRAQGRNGALISYMTDPKHCDTFLAGPDGSFSCQGESFGKTLDKRSLHFTHVAVAGMAAQWMQRWFNDEDIFDKRIVNI